MPYDAVVVGWATAAAARTWYKPGLGIEVDGAWVNAHTVGVEE